MRAALLVALCTVGLTSCTGLHSSAGRRGAVPPPVLAQAQAYMAERLGPFIRYAVYLPDQSRTARAVRSCRPQTDDCAGPLSLYHGVAYRLQLPDGPAADTLEVQIDSQGRVTQALGLPECAEQPTECSTFITEEEARQIARRAGLSRGPYPWETRFHWYNGEPGTYVWAISAYRHLTESEGAYGETAVIDANSGALISLGPFETMP